MVMCKGSRRKGPPPLLKQKAKIPARVGNAIIRLISHLPENVGSIWATPQELRDRLVFAGVDKDLDDEHIMHCLKHCNRSGIIASNTFGRDKKAIMFGRSNSKKAKYRTFYRPSVYTDGSTPSTDHWKESMQAVRVFPLPPRNFFCNNAVTASDCDTVTDFLLECYMFCLDQMASKSTETGSKTESYSKHPSKNDTSTEPSGIAHTRVGFCITDVGLHRDFIQKTSKHAGSCGEGASVEFQSEVRHGSELTEEWVCSNCRKAFIFQSCKWVNTGVPARGKKFSRTQPETNIRIIKAARENGVNFSKARGFLTGIGVLVANYRNMLDQETKIRTVIEGLSYERLEENRRQHVTLSRKQDNYAGDIVWTDEKGEEHNTSRAGVSFDGGGLTRAYNHRIKGAQAAFIVFSLITHRPIAIVHTQVSCILCTRALNAAKRSGLSREELRFSEHAKHKGFCHRTSKHGPAVAEEYSAADAARQLLLGNDDGEYIGDDLAIFADITVGDNDVRTPKEFIAEQQRIIGPEVEGIAEHMPDIGHVIKDCSNNFYKIRDTDPSFRGKDLLENARIRAIMGDVRSAFSFYHEHIGENSKRDECEGRIHAIIPHHCGDHSKCKWDDVCNHLKLQREHPGWSNEQIEVEYAKCARFGGRQMGLSDRGVKVLSKVLFERFDKSNLDRVATMACDNDCELFFGLTSKFSEGKRLCLDHTDLWKSMLLLSLCRSGAEEITSVQLSAKLGLDDTVVEAVARSVSKKKREADHKRLCGDEGKKRRKDAKYTKDIRRGKEDSKKRHKSGKVSLKESAKTTRKKIRPCKKCGQPGHTPKDCPMPNQDMYSKPKGRLAKRHKANLLDW